MAKTETEKILEKRRKIASKLTPRPIELPSHKWRCQVMVGGERLSAVDEDPEVAHATVLAMKANLIERKKAEQPATVTLNDAIESYISSRDNVLSPSTVRGYHVIRKNYFQTLMKTKVHNIDEFTLQQAINKEAKTRSTKTIKNGMGLILTVLSRYKQLNPKLLKYPQKARQHLSNIQI